MSSGESNDEAESEKEAESENDQFNECSENGSQFSYYMCMVCMGTARMPRVSFCGHVFCHSCIQMWMELQVNLGDPKCPYCQSRIGDTTIITVNQTNGVLYNSDGTLTNVPVAEHRVYCDSFETLIPPLAPSFVVGGSLKYQPEMMPRNKPLDAQLLQGQYDQEEEEQALYVVSSMWQRFVILVLIIGILFFHTHTDTIYV